MKIEKINYQRAYVTGPFLQDKLGIEISIDTDRGETPEAAYSWGKEIMDNWHKQNNPHLEGTIITDALGPPREIQVDKSEWEAARIEILVKDIENETVLRNPDGTGGLLAWKMIAATNPTLQAAFDLRKSQLELEKNLKDMEAHWPHQKTQKQ